MTQHPQSRSTPRFTQIIHDALAHWQSRTATLDDDLIQALDADRENLFRLVEFGLGLAETQRATAVLMNQLYPLVQRRSYEREWIPLLERATEDGNSADPILQVKLLNQLGQLRRLRRQLPAALAAHQEAAKLSRQASDPFLLAQTQYNLSEVYYSQRNYEAAQAQGEAALDAFSQLEVEKRWVAAMLNTLGVIARDQGDLEKAERLLGEAAALRRELPPPLSLTRTLNDLATIWERQGKFEQAEAAYQEGNALLEETSYERDKAIIQINLGTLYYRKGQWEAAETIFRRGYSHIPQWDITYRGSLANNLGNVLFKQGRLGEAAVYLRQAEALWRDIDNSLQLANTVGTLAQVMKAAGKRETAVAHFSEAIALLENYPDTAWARKLLAEFRADYEELR